LEFVSNPESRIPNPDMRLFIAADLPADARGAIAAEQQRMASALGDKEREPFPGHRSATCPP
jgi:hypothetical protein